MSHRPLATGTDCNYIKRKCGVEFRLSVRRFWQNPSKDKRCNTPHQDRNVRHTKCTDRTLSIKDEAPFVCPLACGKLSDFLTRTCEKHFLTMSAIYAMRRNRVAKVAIFFGKETVRHVFLLHFLRQRPVTGGFRTAITRKKSRQWDVEKNVVSLRDFLRTGQ